MKSMTTGETITTLEKYGDQLGLTFGSELLDALGIDQATPLKLTVRGRSLVVEVASPEDRTQAFQQIVRETAQENAELFRRLAK